MYIMYLTNNCSKITLSSILSLGSSLPLQLYLTSVKNGQVEMEECTEVEMKLEAGIRNGMGTDCTKFLDTCYQLYKADCDDC